MSSLCVFGFFGLLDLFGLLWLLLLLLVSLLTSFISFLAGLLALGFVLLLISSLVGRFGVLTIGLSWVERSGHLLLEHGLLHLHLLLLLGSINHMWWHHLLRSEGHWEWLLEVLVRIEITSESSRKGSEIMKTGDLNHRRWLEWHWLLRVWIKLVAIASVVSSVVTVFVVLQFLWHWRKSHALWKIRKRVNEASALLFVVVE